MSQSLTKLYVHLVFSTKNREPNLHRNELPNIYAYIIKTLADNHCFVEAIGGTTNHIHILFQLHKTISLSDLVRIVKTNSAKMINQTHHNCYWQDGYAAFSVSQSVLENVKQYILGQEEHHKVKSFQDELRQFLQAYDIPFDERYVWD